MSNTPALLIPPFNDQHVVTLISRPGAEPAIRDYTPDAQSISIFCIFMVYRTKKKQIYEFKSKCQPMQQHI